jgi:sarcosine oxidase subunit beta
MALHSYDRYQTFEQELGNPIDFRKIGWIFLETETCEPWLREHVEMLRTLGIETEILTPDDLQTLYPALNVEDVTLATWGPADGPVDAHMILSGYTRRARDLGVQIIEHIRATDIRYTKGKIEAVETTSGSIATRTLVNAAGPWAGEIGAWVGVEIPLQNAARTVVVTNSTPDIPFDHPFVEDLSTEWYFRPEGDGVLMARGKTPVREAEVGLDREMVIANIEAAVHRVPCLRTAGVRTAWTGVRPLTPDGLPILGTVDDMEGLILNCGWGGMGIIQAPIAGEWVAEYLQDGLTRCVDIRPFQLERFRPGSLP